MLLMVKCFLLNAFPKCSKVVEIGCVKAWRCVCVGGPGDRSGGWGELVTAWYVGRFRVGPGSSGLESFIRWFGAVQVEGCGLGGLAWFLWFLSVLCSPRVSVVLLLLVALSVATACCFRSLRRGGARQGCS